MSLILRAAGERVGYRGSCFWSKFRCFLIYKGNSRLSSDYTHGGFEIFAKVFRCCLGQGNLNVDFGRDEINFDRSVYGLENDSEIV